MTNFLITRRFGASLTSSSKGVWDGGGATAPPILKQNQEEKMILESIRKFNTTVLVKSTFHSTDQIIRLSKCIGILLMFSNGLNLNELNNHIFHLLINKEAS